MRPSVKRALKAIAIGVAIVLFAGAAYVLGATGSLSPETATVSVESQRAGVATDQSAGGMGYGTKESVGAPEAAPAPTQDAAGGATADARVVIRTASMKIRIKAMDDAISKVRQEVSAAKAEITDLYIDEGPGGEPIPYEKSASSDYPSNATITIRVPAEKLEVLQKRLAEIGTVTSESTSASDVTEQHIDLTARLKNLKAQEAQLRDFFNKATKVSDLLAIEQELSRVRGEIESMQAQIDYLDRQAARATLTVTLTEPGPVVSPSGTSWGVTEAITNGLRGAMAIVNGTITLVIALAPFAAILAVVWLVVRALRRRRASRVVAADDADVNE